MANRIRSRLLGPGRFVIAFALLIGLTGRAEPARAQAPVGGAATPVPVLAYYYIWFDPGSWDRAKIDYPTLGRYSSDDPEVMRQHIRWAKAAGIQGFIVSWKSTPTLDARLDKLITIAEQEDFKLAIIYEGLDFNRDPLPVTTIDADIGYFIKTYASRAPFQILNKPLVIWSGIWKYSRADVASLAKYREQVLLLGTQKNTKDYESIADLLDGNAYYWSSVNPETNTGYESKLNAMAQAIHAHHGLWIAPAAPGFDARLVGGTTVVDRQAGDTLRQQMNAAMQASPDAIGIISWNEFSENTYIEPSQKFDDRYLQVLAQMTGSPGPTIPDFDSSEPSDTLPSVGLDRIVALGGLGGLVVLGLAVVVRRQWKRREF